MQPAAVLGQSIYVVAPSGLDSVEGDTFANPALDAVPLHVQLLYPAANFATLDESHRWITQFAVRPDASTEESKTVLWDQIEIYFSTTPATRETMSLTFSDNWGSDRQLVYSGALTFHTTAEGPPAGPRPFDYLVDLQQPFRYDPSQGSLLLEVISTSGYTPALVDDYHLSAEGTWLVGSIGDAAAETGAVGIPDVAVVRFTFVPEASGITAFGIGMLTLLTRRKLPGTARSQRRLTGIHP
jgi:hypothetical protein